MATTKTTKREYINRILTYVHDEDKPYLLNELALLDKKSTAEKKPTAVQVANEGIKADIAEAVEKPVEAPDDNGNWHVYYRVADENVLASRLHERIMSKETEIAENHTSETISYSDREQVLLDYLRNHGGITLDGYMKLAHISEETATRIVVALHSMGVLSLQYHDGQCLIVGD